MELCVVGTYFYYGDRYDECLAMLSLSPVLSVVVYLVADERNLLFVSGSFWIGWGWASIGAIC